MREAEFADDLGPQMQRRICNFPGVLTVKPWGPGSVPLGMQRRGRKALSPALWTAD